MDQITVIYHSYYPDYLDDIKTIEKLSKYYELTLFINNISNNRIQREKSKILSNAFLFSFNNIGKDIGAKFLLINEALKLGISEGPVLFLHDKKSPQTNFGKEWKDKLFKIATPKFAANAIGKINSGAGIVCTKEALMSSEHLTIEELLYKNESKTNQLIKKYNLKVNDYSFVGGAMFWADLSIYSEFFRNNKVSDIVQPMEKGNVIDLYEGTYTHSWERIFSYLSTSTGKPIVTL